MKYDLAIIGIGNMGGAFVRALVEKKILRPDRLLLIGSDASTLAAFAGSECTTNSDARLSQAACVILATKPQDAAEAARQAESFLHPSAVILSIMAGVSIRKLRQFYPKQSNFIRSMPNLGARINRGVTGYIASPGFEDQKLPFVESVLGSFGTVTRFHDEPMLDAVVAVTGSGPGYVFLFMEEMIKAAIGLGFPPEDARKMVIETFVGASLLASLSEESPTALRTKVANKGGTTEAGLNVLAAGEFGELVERAVRAAHARSAELDRLS